MTTHRSTMKAEITKLIKASVIDSKHFLWDTFAENLVEYILVREEKIRKGLI